MENQKIRKNLRKAIDALKKVELYDYVKKLDKGLDHVLLSNGKELSGGQKQKLIIARAIYFKKEIFIFDEATNSLDKKTENNIINLLKSMTPERTIILISHDLEVINKTDLIIKLNKRSANFKSDQRTKYSICENKDSKNNFLYISETNFPNDSASSIAILKMCAAFSRFTNTDLLTLSCTDNFRKIKKDFLIKDNFKIISLFKKPKTINLFIRIIILFKILKCNKV